MCKVFNPDDLHRMIGIDIKAIARKKQRAFDARLAYEKNCMAKYDYPVSHNRPSRPIPAHESMGAYAAKYGTTIKEMKDCEVEVEIAIDEER
jgi:hypothetical protein